MKSLIICWGRCLWGGMDLGGMTFWNRLGKVSLIW